MPGPRQIGIDHQGRVWITQERIMIGTAARILLGLIAGAAMLIAVAIALCTDLFAPETRPSLRVVRPTLARLRRRPDLQSRAGRPLMEAGT